MTAIKPAAPTRPETTNSANNVIISFVDPSSNYSVDYGAALIRYYIWILDATGQTYFESLANCNGQNSVVISNKSCTLTVNTLKTAPYYLVDGQSVYVKIVAQNIVGNSPDSSLGNGAKILITYEPDAPVQIKRDILNTNKL